MVTFKERWKNNMEGMKLRGIETLVNAILWLPVLAIGLILFFWATATIPLGDLADFRIKMAMVFGKSFVAVYLGQLIWNMLFPLLEEEALDSGQSNLIEGKEYNIMYGRLIIHVIMQIVFLYV